MPRRSAVEMDTLDPEHWSGDFSDGRSFFCRHCGLLIPDGCPVVIIVDEEVDLASYYHPSCYVIAEPRSDLTRQLLFDERV